MGKWKVFIFLLQRNVNCIKGSIGMHMRERTLIAIKGNLLLDNVGMIQGAQLFQQGYFSHCGIRDAILGQGDTDLLQGHELRRILRINGFVDRPVGSWKGIVIRGGRYWRFKEVGERSGVTGAGDPSVQRMQNLTSQKNMKENL